MSKRYLGGFITKTPTVPTSSSASGIWTLEQQAQYVKAGTWPGQGKTVEIKVWGAGGGYGDYQSTNGENGGPGGYATATFSINPGTTLSIFVGQGGGNNTDGGNANGGVGGTNGAGPSEGGRGGGFTGVFVGSHTWANLEAASISSSNALIVAGSGGGASYYSDGEGGGYGGGTTGSNGMNRVSSGGYTGGSGGTATAGGANSGDGATSGSLYKGGAGGGSSSNAPGGGGGAGWYGGGGSGNYGGGGGGSGMIASITSGTSLPTGVNSVTGNSFSTQTGTAVTAPNNSDSDYVSGRGTGGISNPNTNGGDGYIVIYVNGSKTTYSYTGDVQTLTV